MKLDQFVGPIAFWLGFCLQNDSYEPYECLIISFYEVCPQRRIHIKTKFQVVYIFYY